MNPRKILVIQEKMIGDVLISTIICNNLKHYFPQAKIHYLVAPNTLPVLKGNPNIDQLVIYSDLQKDNPIEFLGFLKSIRLSQYDVIIDAYGKIGSNLISFFSGAKKRIGYKEKDRFFSYNTKVHYSETKKTIAGLAIERRLELLKPLIGEAKVDELPKIFFDEEEILLGKEKVKSIEQTTKCMLSLFGSSENKSYPEKYMVQLLNYLGEMDDLTILLNYLPDQEEKAQKLIAQCNNQTKQKINTTIFGKGLRDFILLMNACDLLIGNDGGAVNIAKALDKPTFTIFSPWIPKDIWSILEDGQKHIGVHLNDYKPELFKNKEESFLKNHTDELYQEFKPELLKDQLEFFVKNNRIN